VAAQVPVINGPPLRSPYGGGYALGLSSSLAFSRPEPAHEFALQAADRHLISITAQRQRDSAVYLSRSNNLEL